MNKNTGCKQMLRDRCPKVINYALKWCKAKEKWIDCVYKSNIWIYCNKQERINATKIVLGVNTKEGFNFHTTIPWENLTQDGVYYWSYVESWVDFFRKKYAYIENAYLISMSQGSTIAECKYDIMKNYLLDLCPKKTDSEEVVAEKTKYINKLTDFLIDCFEDRIQ